MPTFDDVRQRLQTPLAEAVRTSPSLVRLSPEPVDDATVLTCLELASYATVGGHRPCEFVVLRDPDVKHQLARIYRQGWSVYKRLLRGRDEARTRARQWEADHFEDVPVVVIACVRGLRPVFPAFNAARWYASVFPAVQNLLLGAHALGLGATITTLPIWSGWESRRTLGLAWSVTPVAVVPLGWPREEPAAPVPRPVGEMTHLDRFGHQPFRAHPVGR